jgi:RNA polymerase sigma-70 factor (ECF subfamily)
MPHTFPELIRRFYETHRQELYTYALLLTRSPDAAEDAIHTAFCNLLRRGRAPKELRPYIFRCIRNAAVDELRRAQRPEPPVAIFAPVDPAHGLNGRAHLEEALGDLAEDERESIVLKLYNGLTFKEIATTRKVSINTAASWYRRGIEKLRLSMQEDKSHE